MKLTFKSHFCLTIPIKHAIPKHVLTFFRILTRTVPSIQQLLRKDDLTKKMQ